ncbi:hypothetical protein ASE01_00115 [Nocardioides sp. Root190]|uniref:FliH/SctL family protein n=1 Tax=Nocardioides sp. Root190 TaxID=1736488 RepID=UPI0006FA720A|nr:FliH/SctL family protein [Nocardioides sp. Root190]KRB79957.1 hypothetical protein ASE01_00115 [Nocardioides sp. Root190]
MRASEHAVPELRVGNWTRLGGSAVLGDRVTESMLDVLAEKAREAARAQGYAVGWAEGRRTAAGEALREEAARVDSHAAAESRRAAEHRAAIDALGRAAEQVRGLLDGLAAAIEEQATDLALALTAEILGARAATATAPDVVARVLQVLPAAPVGTVRLHPSVADASSVRDLADRGLTVLPDPTLGRADALVESPDGSVTDLRVDEAMARVRGVLG